MGKARYTERQDCASAREKERSIARCTAINSKEITSRSCVRPPEEAADAVHRALETSDEKSDISQKNGATRTLYWCLGEIDHMKASVIRLDIKDASRALVPCDRLDPSPQIGAEDR